jgi:tetratricopeptide (TPR) repeat protein
MTGRAVSLLLLALLAAAGCSSNLDLSKSSTQMRVGVRAARSNLWREALFRFQRATQIAPADAAALNNLAVAYEGTGDFEKARETYIAALQADRSNQYIQKNYSRFVEFYSKNKKRQKSVEGETPADAAAPASPSSAPATAAPVVTPPPSDTPAAPAEQPPSEAEPPAEKPEPETPADPPAGGAH